MFNDRSCDKTRAWNNIHTDTVSAGLALRVNWRRRIQSHPPQTPSISGGATSRYHLPTPRYSAASDGHVRLYADCGCAKFDSENRLISVACPAVLCGSVSVSDNRIGEHRTWDAQPCRWIGACIIDDSAATVRVVS
ncbi:hypothetical protein [Nocardia pseudovaccinii]|uniref:hypothetical protein n=1 Tax=Nocardia pseudovaccinii TaxID=189540 RepID=UPI0007A47F9D|nr:hypothetical protein [Nocardia pseudovaccinii]